MSLNILKEYLVKIGFKVDDKAFKNTEKKIETTGKKIGKTFQDGMKLPFEKVFGKETANVLGKTGKHIAYLGDVISYVNKQIKKTPTKEQIAKLKTLQFTITEAGEAAKGTTFALAGLSTETVLIGGVIAAGAIAVAGLTLALNSYIQSIAQADLKTEFFARRMLMTKEHALSLQETMKVMGVNNVNDLIDVLNNPKTRSAYLENRKLANDMAGQLKGHGKGLEAFQNLNFEFQRMQMTADFAFKMTGARLAENLIEPIQGLTKLLKWINDFVSHHLLKTVDTAIKALAPFGIGNIATIREGFGHLQSGDGNKALTAISRQILDILKWFKDAWDKFWGVFLNLPFVKEAINAGKTVRDIITKGAEIGGQARQAVSNWIAPPASAETGQNMRDVINSINSQFPGQYDVISTTGGRHAKHSLHYQGRAMDIVPRDGSERGYIQLAQFLSRFSNISRIGVEGFGSRASDLIGKMSGVRNGVVQNMGSNANTTGKHLHIEFKNNFNISSSSGRQIADDIHRKLAYQARQHRVTI